MSEAFDYIVVGAGLAGCLVARRLAEDTTASVLLLEAGPASEDSRISTPPLWPELTGSEFDWAYETTPQCGLDGRMLTWPRGRVLGGSAAINAMVYIRGHASDYAAWEAHGGTAWGPDSMLGAMERLESAPSGVPVMALDDPHPLSLAFIEAATRTGLPRSDDFNSGSMDGVGLYRTTRVGAARWTTAQSLGRNHAVTVRPATHVTRVLVSGSAAYGVSYISGEIETRVHARREVVLCAGTLGSAQLLLLSGIGPAAELERVRITPVIDVAGVGANLHDHIQVSVSFPVSEAVPVSPDSNLGEAGGFVSTATALPAPDVQLSFAPMIGLNGARRIGAGFTIGPAVTRPLSRGSLKLASPNWADRPLIDPAYLTEQQDIDTLVSGVRVALSIAEQEPLRAARAPHDASTLPSDAEPEKLKEFVRRRAQTQYHPVGTCRLGKDPHAVVDPELRLRGVEALRVVDASVMPSITTGNIQAPVLAIAMLGSDMLAKDAQ